MHTRSVLEELLNVSVASYRSVAEAAGLSLNFHCDPELPAIRGDAQRLKQVFMNLISNAVRFTRAGGEIRVEAEALPMAVPRYSFAIPASAWTREEIQVASDAVRPGRWQSFALARRGRPGPADCECLGRAAWRRAAHPQCSAIKAPKSAVILPSPQLVAMLQGRPLGQARPFTTRRGMMLPMSGTHAGDTLRTRAPAAGRTTAPSDASCP